MSGVIVFDVNGTLLDVQALAPQFQKLFGDLVSVREWFVELLHYSLAMTVAGDYAAMGDVAEAVLKMTAGRLGRNLDSSAIAAIKEGLSSLPPFPDVKPALTTLQAAGFRLAALSNSSTDNLEKQLSHAGLARFFEQALSVERVRRFKPAPEPYQAAAQALGISKSDLLMVAAHGWDVFGALRAGCRAAFIERAGQSLFPLGPSPDYFAQNLTQLADQLTASR